LDVCNHPGAQDLTDNCNAGMLHFRAGFFFGHFPHQEKQPDGK
jgi:hypothetical protein